jgi:deoxyribodipyrimidine photo-lyase
MDFFLQNPTVIKTNMDRPYTIYSQFYKKARTFPVRKIRKNSLSNFYRKKISNYSIFASNGQEDSFGGRTKALTILNTLDKFKNYDSTRDYPSNLTTRLSAHIKFGTLSIREIHNAILGNLGSSHTLMREIYWREFFNYICFHFPSSTQKSFKKKYQKFPWIKSKVLFAAWCSGNTGFPIVDAGMRELNKTGFMHNRVRMIVGSFLTKDLHIDWKLGERYFAKKLVDYDPAVNSGNWQWVASTGCDSVPYFRIFNPWIQQEKFDKECIYIKKWIPELGPFSPEVVHNLWKTFPENLNYASPIVNHKVEAQKTKELFKKLS